MNAKEVFLVALEELKQSYENYDFMVSRDVTWTLQKKIRALIEKIGLSLDIYHDYPLEKGVKNHKDNELVLVNEGTNYKDLFSGNAQAELVVRILFEPSPFRRDICPHHLPHVLVTDLIEAIEKVQSLVELGKVRQGILIFIDEAGRYRHKVVEDEHVSWKSWNTNESSELNLSILIATF